MDFTLTDEQLALQASVRQFANKELPAIAREIGKLAETIAWADCWSMGKPIRSARGEAHYGAAAFTYYAGAVRQATVTTELRPTSLPVPAVVGTATNGASAGHFFTV